ncbi:MAG: ATP-grasp domain-containing protein [Gemmatimonadetes bacterium]|nr:ATP-grasp domain-containing protein [Gemmatimonadota bacterium]
MRTVAFVAPYFLDTTIRFVKAAGSLQGVRLFVLSKDSEKKLPPDVLRVVEDVIPVADPFDARSILAGALHVRKIAGRVDRLIGAMEELQVPLAEVRQELRLPGLAVETAKNFRDKGRMKTILQKAGLPCARHGRASSREEAIAKADEIGFPLVAKPPSGSGARSTYRLETSTDLEEYLDRYPPSSRQEVLFEEFVRGAEHSFDSVFVEGKPLWYSIARYYPTPLEVIENPWIQWVVLLPRVVETPEFDDIRAAAVSALETLGLDTGLTHMEWFRREDGSLAISEVAARPPGAQFTTLISYAYDFDMYRAWAKLAIFETFEAPARSYAAGAAYLRGQGSGSVVQIEGVETAARELGALVVESKLPSIGQAAAGSYEGEGYVILRHPDTAVVAEGLKRLIQILRIELG